MILTTNLFHNTVLCILAIAYHLTMEVYAHPGETDTQGCHGSPRHCEHEDAAFDATVLRDDFFVSQRGKNASNKPVLVEFTSNQHGNLYLFGSQKVSLSTERSKGYLLSGWNKLLVSGRGILPQTFYLYFDAKKSFPPFFIALRKEHNTRSTIYWPDIQATKLPHYSESVTLHNQHSTCRKLNLTIPPTQRINSQCKYKSLFNEIYAIGPYFASYVVPGEVNLTYHAFLEEFHRFYPSRRLSILGETMHRTSWDGLTGFEAASYAALTQGDCRRVHTIAKDVYKLNLLSPTTFTHLALCYEQAGLKDEAEKLLASIQVSLKGINPEGAALLYHLARIKGKDDILKAESIYKQCRTLFPWFRPCYERLADIAVAKGAMSSQKNIMEQWDTFSQNSIANPIRQSIQFAENRQYDQALEILNAMPYQTVSFSSLWLRLALEHHLQIQTKDKYHKMHLAFLSRIIHQPSAEHVIRYLQAQNYTPFLDSALQNMLRHHYHTEDAFHLARLSQYWHDNQGCHKLLSINFPQPQKPLSEEYADALDYRSQCAIASNDLRGHEIESILKHAHTLVQGSWRSYYRLGQHYQRQKVYQAALSYYQHAIKQLPTKDGLQQIQKDIEYLTSDDVIKDYDDF